MKKMAWKAIVIAAIRRVVVSTTAWMELLYRAKDPNDAEDDFRSITKGIYPNTSECHLNQINNRLHFEAQIKGLIY